MQNNKICPRCHHNANWLLWVENHVETRKCKKCGHEFNVDLKKPNGVISATVEKIRL
jgi:uncharacterized metal-binding protein (TIGR02443 family)